MTSEEEFFTKLVALAKLVGGSFELTKDIAKIYDMHLSPFGYDRVCRALDQIILDRNSRDPFPSIKEIRSILQPESNPESEAALIASRIVSAVAKIGPYQSSVARSFIGSIGWCVVEGEGGWANVCSALTYENLGILKAQWRNLAKAFLERSGGDLTRLPQSPKKQGLSSFDGKLISVPKSDSDEEECG